MTKTDDHHEPDPLAPDPAEATPVPAEGASDSTLIILLAAVVGLLLLCIAFVLIAS